MKLSKYITPLLLATALACPTITLADDISVTKANVASLMKSSSTELNTWDAGKSKTGGYNVFSIDEDITIYLAGNVNLKSQINISAGKTLTIINNSTKTNSDNGTEGNLYGAQYHGVKIDNKMDDNVGGTISSRKCMFYIKPGAKLILDSRSSSGSGNPGNLKMQINGMCHNRWALKGTHWTTLGTGAPTEKKGMGFGYDSSSDTEYRPLTYGGIFNCGTLEVYNCVFRDFCTLKITGTNTVTESATNNSGTTQSAKFYDWDFRGFGVITVSGTKLNKAINKFPNNGNSHTSNITTILEDCYFHENASYYGVVLNVVGKTSGTNTITIRNCDIFHNVVRNVYDTNQSTATTAFPYSNYNRWGGVIRTAGNTNANIELINTKIHDNYADNECSGVFFNAKNIRFDGCDIYGNETKYCGGGLRIESSCEFSGGITRVHDNKAATEGGGIHIIGYANGSNAEMTGSAKNFVYNLNGNLEVYNNMAQNGGGLAFDFNSSCKLYTGSSLTVNFDGAKVYNNTATANGGGIWSQNTTDVGKYTIKTYLNSGDLYNNTAVLGGGIYISTSNIEYDAASANSSMLYVKENTATGTGGGGIYLKDGNITLREVSLLNNRATSSAINEGNGGGVYLTGTTSTFTIDSRGLLEYNDCVGNGGGAYLEGATMTINDGDVSNNGDNIAPANGGGLFIKNGTLNFGGGTIRLNKAGNGAGVAVGNGTINITNGEIHQNVATGNGGGVLVNDGTFTMSNGKVWGNTAALWGAGLCFYATTAHTASFSGGDIYKNIATKHGGGIAARGPVAITTTTANAYENEALNGGAIYLTEGASLAYTDGAIRNNKAKGTGTFTTAYHQGADALSGVGGGIFLDNSATLTFNTTSRIGIFNNLADMAADDIFANGNSTSITLPDVSMMDLTGSGIPSGLSNLSWMEDYREGDSSYDQGTNAMGANWTGNNNERYRKFTIQPYKIAAGTYASKYLSTTLGFDNIEVTIRKTGMEGSRANALFNIYKSDGTKYMTVRLPIVKEDAYGNKTYTWERKIKLPDGSYRFSEDPNWSWSYTKKTEDISANIRDKQLFEFANEEKSGTPLHNEDVKVNTFK